MGANFITFWDLSSGKSPTPCCGIDEEEKSGKIANNSFKLKPGDQISLMQCFTGKFRMKKEGTKKKIIYCMYIL